jgi:beta-lactamase class A
MCSLYREACVNARLFPNEGDGGYVHPSLYLPRPDGMVRAIFGAISLRLRLDRRDVLLGALGALGAGVTRAAETPPPIAQDVALLGAPDAGLEAKIAALAGEAGLRIGFAAVDLVKGRTAFVRGGELFAMAGVRHLPIAVGFLRLVQSGRARLETRVRLTAGDIAPGRSPLAERLRRRTTVFTARQLVEHTLLNGDTTAADALMRLVGGPEKIQAAIRTFAIDGLRVDRYAREMEPQALGLAPSPAYVNPAALDKAFAALGPAKQKEALERYVRDPRDTASPRAIATLFFKLLGGHLVQPRFAMMALEAMRRSKTGDDRLEGGMLPGWSFAHRGGTSRTILGTTGVFNDAGLATNKAGAKIAIVLFIEGATLAPDELARFHRATARAVLQAWG